MWGFCCPKALKAFCNVHVDFKAVSGMTSALEGGHDHIQLKYFVLCYYMQDFQHVKFCIVGVELMLTCLQRSKCAHMVAWYVDVCFLASCAE